MRVRSKIANAKDIGLLKKELDEKEIQAYLAMPSKSFTVRNVSAR